MKTDNLAGTKTLSGEQRSTAYYYGDLERLKRPQKTTHQVITPENPNALSEYVETNEIVNDVPVSEVPPLRDRPLRQSSLPEYHTPEGCRKLPGETYSTAGTFPMPEQKEKEPLLAELEVVGRLPLTQLDTSSGVRRSRSWYLCCPNMGEDEISGESSWRYSSLRPVTAPPLPNRNGMNTMSGAGGAAWSLRAERDALAARLAAERARAAAAARAHDARLAELHGVIAELVRRGRGERGERVPIPEESDADDGCESTTQPAGELDDDDEELSPTEQDDTSWVLSAERRPPSPPSPSAGDPLQSRIEQAADEAERAEKHNYETSLNLSERDSELCLTSARYCQSSRQARSAAGSSCERERGSAEEVPPTGSGRAVPLAKMAARVRLRTGDVPCHAHTEHESWEAAAARLARQVCAQADEREAVVAGGDDDAVETSAALLASRARCLRLQADAELLDKALRRTAHLAHRLASACAVHESSSVALCCALHAADRCLEAYDVLLALAESEPNSAGRQSAELVASQLMERLEAEPAALAAPLLPAGPWARHDPQVQPRQPWSPAREARLRELCAQLKGEAASLRTLRPPPQLFSYKDLEEQLPSTAEDVSMAEMETAVMMQEVAAAREERAEALAALAAMKSSNASRQKKHWLEQAAAETDL